MKAEKKLSPDFLFEVSWEVCNKMGGIHTVITTKSAELAKTYKDNHILIGPDVWMDVTENPEFIEDPLLYKMWRISAATEGLRFRVGRWNIPSKPIVFLVDFTPYISNKDEIMTQFWDRFGLDSISGHWDYVESLLFGYATGKLIESFIKFNTQPATKVVAHFHEWMSGAGLLYLKDKKLPVSTMFTTHSTVLGRSVASNHIPLYSQMYNIEADSKAKELNVMAKHSLEKCAANEADVFTTVSDLTARECEQFLGRKVDIVTPNGFDPSFVPEDKELKGVRQNAKDKLISVASHLLNKEIVNPIIIGTSGRYEYRNKGLDLFIDTVQKLSQGAYTGDRPLLVYIMVPAGEMGAKRDIDNRRILNPGYTTFCSHYLRSMDNDIMFSRIRSIPTINNNNSKIDLIYVPSYLKGDDGMFDMTYYDLLPGFDLTLFASYYEPWGYTPLESLAFKVPSLSTTLAGFSLWVNSHYKGKNTSMTVLERDDDNYGPLVDQLTEQIIDFSKLTDKELTKVRDNARVISNIALWEEMVEYYYEAFNLALQKKGVQTSQYDDNFYNVNNNIEMEVNNPSWTKVFVSRFVPERLKSLDVISKNLWWCWNQSAMELFESIDKELWSEVKGNPIAMLEKTSLERYKELEGDKYFLAKLDSVATELQDYMNRVPEEKGASVAYFCMEYGLDTSLKIYSGGLGILAGDYLKESSDMMVDMTAVGFLYRYGYFQQKLTAQGEQTAQYEAQDFLNIPAVPVRDKDGHWVTVSVAFPGRNIYARVWLVEVGMTKLYLMDTDFEDNLEEDRQVTHHLYGGDWENRIKQELLLGIGGIRLLRAVGVNPEVYHCNEGHAAFIGLERLREYVQEEKLLYTEALELVRASSLFTTHTPVPAGHDAFEESLLRKYIAHYPERLKIDWSTLVGLGRVNAEDKNEKFSMSNLACRLSQEVNGVSWLHGEVSKEILAGLWKGSLENELHIGYVTNGVHYPTWTSPLWKNIHSKVFGPEFATHHYNKECFSGIYSVSDAEIWEVRSELRKKLIKTVKGRLSDSYKASYYSPQQIVKIKKRLRDNVLTIGFARRFATYKRAHLLFRDLDALDRIINNEERPVQFIFAGKAHPADKAGQDLIKRIVEISKLPQFIGKIVFVQDYDITLGKRMVQGVDVWMNTPTRPLEASGTSGEKAAMNGVMHFSVLDGWWVEGYRENAGWALPMERTYDDQNFQDELDAATIYNILEQDIVGTFYNVDDKSSLPVDWIQIIKNTVAKVACNFTTNRMFEDYIEQYYTPLQKRFTMLLADNYAKARELAFWKKTLRAQWQHINIISWDKPHSTEQQIFLGGAYTTTAKIFIGDLNPNDIGVELVISTQNKKGAFVLERTHVLKVESVENGVATYKADLVPSTTGVFNLTGRIFAKNDLLPNRQDFELVRWL